MTGDTKAAIDWWLGTLWRGAVIIGMAAGIVWAGMLQAMDDRYASSATVEANSAALQEMAVALSEIVASLERDRQGNVAIRAELLRARMLDFRLRQCQALGEGRRYFYSLLENTRAEYVELTGSPAPSYPSCAEIQ